MLDIRDTLACVELALLNPADEGEFRVFNQFTESFSVQQHGRDGGRRLPRPRRRSTTSTTPGWRRRSTTTGRPHTKLLDLGLVPHLLDPATDLGRCWPSSTATATGSTSRPSRPTVQWRSTASALPTSANGDGQSRPPSRPTLSLLVAVTPGSSVTRPMSPLITRRRPAGGRADDHAGHRGLVLVVARGLLIGGVARVGRANRARSDAS